MSNQEARVRGIGKYGRDPTLYNPRPTKCIWKERKAKKVIDAKQILLCKTSLDEEIDGIADDDEDDDDGVEQPSQRTPPSNPFIDKCRESRKRKNSD